MNILLITTTYPTATRPHQGAFNRALVTALRARHDVRVIAPVPWTELLGKVPLGSGASDGLQPIYFYPPKLLRAHYHRFYWRSIQGSVRRLARDFRPELVLGYWLHPDGAAAVRAARHFGVPAIVMSGGTDLRLRTGDSLRRRAITRVLAAADRVIVFSRELATHAHRLGTETGKVDVIYRGIDRECFRPMSREASRAFCKLDRDDVVVLWVGRFAPVKNPDLLLEAAVAWQRRWGDRLKVILVGEGARKQHMRQRVNRLGLQGVVRFAGGMSQPELARHFNAADVTVVTSHSEGIPNVLLESIACGTPFVATDVGGIAEIASPGLDHLVSAGDSKALAEAVVRRLGSRTVGHRMFVPSGLAGMCDQFDAVFGNTLADHPRPTRHFASGRVVGPPSHKMRLGREFIDG